MVKITNFLKKNKFALAILVLMTIVFFRWISFDIFSANDWYFVFSDSLRDLTIPSIWVSHSNFGQVPFTIWRYPFDFMAALLASFGYDSNITDKFLYFWPLIIFSSLGSYLLAKKILKSEIAAFVAAIVFSCNSYFFSITGQGHLLISLAGALSTFALLFFISYFETKKITTALIAFLIAFAVGVYDLRVMYLIIGVFILYWLWELVVIKSFQKPFLQSILPFLFLLLIFGLLNLFWLLPSIKGGSLSDNQILNRGLFGDQFWSMIHAMTLHHPFWNGGKIIWFTVQRVPLYYYLIPILSLIGAIIYRKNKQILFFLFLALIGIFFAKQADAPFPQIYLWLYQNIPGFNAFREASKFYLFIIIGFSILIGALTKWLWHNKKIIKIWKYTPHLLTSLILIIFLYNVKPIMSGEIDTLYLPTKIPSDYQKIKDMETAQNGYFNVLWMPACSRWAYYSNEHPGVCGNEMTGSTWKNITGFSQVGTTYPKQAQITNIIEYQDFEQLLKQGSIKYIIVPTKDWDYGDDLFQYYGDSKGYLNLLDQKRFLKKINIETPDTVIYEYDNFNPLVSLSNVVSTSSQNTTSIDYKMINASQYNVSIKNLKQNSTLNFGQNFDNNWSIKVGDFSALASIANSNYSALNIIHQKSSVGFNQFIIDPQRICQVYKCQKNENGSFNIDLVIYHKAQGYLYLGLIISAITFILMLFLILISSLKNLKKVKNVKNS